jgi:hypothetical protein
VHVRWAREREQGEEEDEAHASAGAQQREGCDSRSAAHSEQQRHVGRRFYCCKQSKRIAKFLHRSIHLDWFVLFFIHTLLITSLT